MFRFYFDVASVQSWILFEHLKAAEQAFNIVGGRYLPVRSPAIYIRTGSRDPYYTLALRREIFEEIGWLRQIYNVPLQIPQDAERKLSSIGTASAQHFLAHISVEHESRLADVARRLWQRLWIEQREIQRHVDFEEILKELNIPTTSTRIDSDIKSEQILKAAETQALRDGCFNVPFVTIRENEEDEAPRCFHGMDMWPAIAKRLKVSSSYRAFAALRTSEVLYNATSCSTAASA